MRGPCRLSSVGQSDALVMRRSPVRIRQAAPRRAQVRNISDLRSCTLRNCNWTATRSAVDGQWSQLWSQLGTTVRTIGVGFGPQDLAHPPCGSRASSERDDASIAKHARCGLRSGRHPLSLDRVSRKESRKACPSMSHTALDLRRLWNMTMSQLREGGVGWDTVGHVSSPFRNEERRVV
jgi:hypothetical protein